MESNGTSYSIASKKAFFKKKLFSQRIAICTICALLT